MVTVVEVPGLPSDVEVRRSTRRRRTVTAYREAGRTVVVVPGRMPAREIPGHVRDLMARLARRDSRGRVTDADLEARAAALSARYLGGAAVPTSVRWVDNQHRRWGSCTPVDGSIRLSRRLAAMPDEVRDYVLLHELAHLIESGHGPDFEALLAGYGPLERARGFLDGVAFADAVPAPQAAGPGTAGPGTAAPQAAGPGAAGSGAAGSGAATLQQRPSVGPGPARPVPQTSQERPVARGVAAATLF